jgi:uncharacterized protein (TIGR02444 family)
LQLSLENPLWDFTLAVYPEAGVSDELIALQDRLGLDVNLLLFCAYMGGLRSVTLTADELGAVRAAVMPFQRDVISPLRTARRALKPVDAEAAQALRESVKKDELQAEKIEQALLWAECERLSGRTAGDRATALYGNIAALTGPEGAPKLAAAVLRQAAKT